MKNNKQSGALKIALCGIMSALCIVVMTLGYIFPFATYRCPAVAAVFLFPVVYEYGMKTGFTMFAAVSFLSVFMIPDYEMTLMFILVFGLYTVLKFSIDRKFRKGQRIVIRFLYVNITVVAVYVLLLVIFPVQALLNEFAEYSIYFVRILMVLFNVTFFFYDKALEKLLIIYVHRFRKKLFRN